MKTGHGSRAGEETTGTLGEDTDESVKTLRCEAMRPDNYKSSHYHSGTRHDSGRAAGYSTPEVSATPLPRVTRFLLWRNARDGVGSAGTTAGIAQSGSTGSRA